MNANPAGVQFCSQSVIMYEKHGTISEKMVSSCGMVRYQTKWSCSYAYGKDRYESKF